MCIGIVWHEVEQGERKCLPDSPRRVLVAQDDGYIEMAYWDGTVFAFDWPLVVYGSAKPGTLPPRMVPRVRYWCDLPETPTENLP
jgi:hypothetical protein